MPKITQKIDIWRDGYSVDPRRRRSPAATPLFLRVRSHMRSDPFFVLCGGRPGCTLSPQPEVSTHYRCQYITKSQNWRLIPGMGERGHSGGSRNPGIDSVPTYAWRGRTPGFLAIWTPASAGETGLGESSS